MTKGSANPAHSYLAAAVKTASPGQLTLMLFDGMLRFLDRALEGFEHSDHKQRNELVNNNILRAQDIISELQQTLNMKVEGGLSETLYKLYDYMFRELQKANLQKDTQPIETVHGFMKEIRDAWELMLQQHDTARPSGQRLQA